eukprot:gnl/TRDRNA2_/TRDRNA2_32126_c0_seq1.p1 gnl/TRDRNA2_/TRDRNA2_32126_c0~~gnl/TRDRNA2_/TRDRNA2_32126_c0_seq1.p1  ORF type:complete len:346 (+),score=47.61 gnl/TRDRNA2_/TRDRNA2_32126_c0_seq1:41-1078(+)
MEPLMVSLRGLRCFAAPAAVRCPATALCPVRRHLGAQRAAAECEVQGLQSYPWCNRRGAASYCVQTVRMASTATTCDFQQGMGEAAAGHVSGGMNVILVPCLSDNYAPIFHDAATGATAVVDTPEVEPILQAIESRGWHLTHILNTHHHNDHTGGNLELKQRTGCKIVGPAGEHIPGIDIAVNEGDSVQVGSFGGSVLEVGGHTAGHIAYHFPDQKAAFVGDTLFNLGCGRLFEGSPAQMWTSLLKIRALPDQTVTYCAHEYTASNARFATHLGGIPQLPERVDAINGLRAEGLPTVPMILGHEKLTNPFLRADDDLVRKAAGLPNGATPVEVFAEVRRQKDNFR